MSAVVEVKQVSVVFSLVGTVFVGKTLAVDRTVVIIRERLS